MATKTVYIPFTFTAEEITDEQVTDIGNGIAAMLRDNFFNSDNVFDAATESGVELQDFKIAAGGVLTDDEN